jgi:hypothetical protein
LLPLCSSTSSVELVALGLEDPPLVKLDVIVPEVHSVTLELESLIGHS